MSLSGPDLNSIKHLSNLEDALMLSVQPDRASERSPKCRCGAWKTGGSHEGLKALNTSVSAGLTFFVHKCVSHLSHVSLLQ